MGEYKNGPWGNANRGATSLIMIAHDDNADLQQRYGVT